ncbi:uncharacterized protein sb:cb288 [Polypterus senegalus]|uniref:uncharacterized protein sb:cb288 n=1 Tax=Polypterus senegalus TaxID=55291 RepID=UPI001964B083|nr:uncharacterized protein sb:cb288 [Polypterus senegalus]
MSLNSSGTRSALQSSPQDLTWRSLGLSGISNGSTEHTKWLPTKPTSSKDEMARGSGIIPAGIAAAVFIGFLLLLYAILWKCMVAGASRKKKKIKKKQPKVSSEEMLC